MTRRHVVLMLPLVVIAGIAGGMWWRNYTKVREITVSIFSDFSFRQRTDWLKGLHTRFDVVNRIYAPSTKVQWRIVTDDLADPTALLSNLDDRRLALKDRTDEHADVLLVYTGFADGPRTGSVNPFSHTALVVDQPNDSDEKNAIRLAHELAHLFGAPHDDKAIGELMAEPPASDRMPEHTATLIRGLRDYNFAASVDGLTDSMAKRAVRLLTDALTAKPTTPDPPSPAAQAHALLALSSRADGRNALSIPEFRQAVKLAPQTASFHLELAAALAQDLQTEEAILELRQAAERQPNDPRLHVALATFLFKTDDPDAAATEVQAALRINPNEASFHAALGSLEAGQTGQIDAAINSLQTALKLNPQLAGTRQNLDRILAYKEQVKAEIASQRSRVQQAPQDANAHYVLGTVEARGGDLDAAAKEYQRAIELDPNEGHAHAALAELHFLRQDYAGAWDEVRKARAAGIEPKGSFLTALKRKMPG
jgi:tetratricopeptide (TPR) repeat protein